MVNAHHCAPAPGGHHLPRTEPAAAPTGRRRAQHGRSGELRGCAGALRHGQPRHSALPGAGRTVPGQSQHSGYRHAPAPAGTGDTGHRR